MVQILKTYRLNIITYILLSLNTNLINAQSVTVEAKLDTAEFLIGDQVGLELKVIQPQKVFVGIPIFDAQLTKQIEVLEQTENDTSVLDDGDWLIKKRLLITTFDSGYYAISPIPVLYYSDTIKSNPILFKVNTMPVDTSEAIKDIKMPYGAPISFAEVMPWAMGGLGLALLIVILVYVIRKIKRKEPIIRRFKPREPAHVIAYRDLSKLKDNKLWQHSRIKDYYTDLTDILRLYLWNRYAIRTLERTSEEILDSMKVSNFEDKEAFNILKETFYTADLVKFAKFKPIVDEHEKCMSGAYNFVDRTKLIVEEKPENTEKEILLENNKKEEVQTLEEKNN